MYVNGPPPRAWGQRWDHGRSRHDARFTPTRVGTTRGLIRVTPRPPRFTPTRVGTTLANLGKKRVVAGAKQSIFKGTVAYIAALQD
jgi:hypothetical protein